MFKREAFEKAAHPSRPHVADQKVSSMSSSLVSNADVCLGRQAGRNLVEMPKEDCPQITQMNADEKSIPHSYLRSSASSVDMFCLGTMLALEHRVGAVRRERSKKIDPQITQMNADEKSIPHSYLRSLASSLDTFLLGQAWIASALTRLAMTTRC